MKKFLLCLWQLPQFLLGMFVILMSEAVKEIYIHTITGKRYIVYFFDRNQNKFCEWLCDIMCSDSDCNCVNDFTWFDNKRQKFRKIFSGCALVVIVLPKGFSKTYYDKTVAHEHGHNIQSIMFGWLYLIFIGIPSICLNLLARKFKVISDKYYTLYPEKWADKLGGVER